MAFSPFVNFDPYDMIRQVAHPFHGQAGASIMLVVFLGMIARPIFIIVMVSIRMKSPLDGKGSGQLIMMAIGALGAAAVLAGGSVSAGSRLKESIFNPVVVMMGRSDTCDPETIDSCREVFVRGAQVWANPGDWLPSEGTWPMTAPAIPAPPAPLPPEAAMPL
ncbi:hypothetical protein [Pseudogemmobacter sp. W21_MBD1_M6]|uniref:hypothetical protein n=1 Tax=Pseudogemmobacter sp. W21_MBD1_M6 TaxID=3240271 RepID=UPI003F98E715